MRVQSSRKQRNQAGGQIFGALFGIGLFLGSFAVLWFNEGRLNFGEIAKDSVPISAATIDQAHEGQFVAAAGDLTTDQQLGDPDFITPNDYIQLNRIIEMYAWREDQETDSNDETYYEYIAEWTSSPENSDTFYDTSYYNPPMAYSEQTFTVSNAWVGSYSIDPRAVEYPTPEMLNLQNESILMDVPIYGEYLYIGDYSLNNPEIGDLRISFTAVSPTQNVTIFGTVSGEQILPYRVDDDDSLYRIFYVNQASAIEQMQEEYTIALWGTRFGGFAMMWCGLFLLFNPITILVSFIPFLQRTGSWLIVALTMPAAAALSIIVIAVSFFAHNLVLLVGLICVSVLALGGIAAGLLMLDRRRKAQQPKQVIS